MAKHCSRSPFSTLVGCLSSIDSIRLYFALDRTLVLSELEIKTIFAREGLRGHGPFVSHSRRYNGDLAVNCRFCGIFEESPEHLLLHCLAFESLEIDGETEMAAIEAKCKRIVNVNLISPYTLHLTL